MVDRKYVFNLIKLEQERSQTALVAGANSISFVNVATVFIKIFETNMQQHQKFYKGFTYSGATITVLHWSSNKLANIYLIEKSKKIISCAKVI